MKYILPILLFFSMTTLPAAKLRVVQETDLGGDPDDQASMVRFLLYSNEWDVEGIIVDRHPDNFSDPNPGQRRLRYGDEKSAMEMMEYFFTAWEQSWPMLSQHADGYPPVERLRTITVPGHADTEAGVELLIQALTRDDPRPLWYGNWGSDSGSESNLKRALDKLERDDAAAYTLALDKLRVVTLDGNAPGGSRLGHHRERLQLFVETGWPEKYGTGFGTRWYHAFRPVNGAKPETVAATGSPLAPLWTGPKEGDTWCFLYLIPNGLSNPRMPTWGGWSGRYNQPQTDATTEDNPEGSPPIFWNDNEDRLPGSRFGELHRNNTASRYGDAVANDFIARLEWTNRPFGEANHPPVPTLQVGPAGVTMGLMQIKAQPGQRIPLRATATDPDGDAVQFSFTPYPEAGTINQPVAIETTGPDSAFLTVPADAAPGSEFHLYLEATDTGTPALTRYARLVVRVEFTKSR